MKGRKTMSPQTMTHLPAALDPGPVRMASQRFTISVLLGLSVALLPGCGDGWRYHHYPMYPDERRATSPCPYSLVLNGPWQQVHQALTAAVQDMTWGPHCSIQHPIEPELGWGTVYPLSAQLWLIVCGFVADVERLTENTTKVTIYPVDEQWKDITRQKIAQVVAGQFPPLSDAPKQ
jgi:hypothetical protein